MERVALFFYTLRHLKWIQIRNRIWRSVYRPSLRRQDLPVLRSELGLKWTGVSRRPSLIAPHTFHLLNCTVNIVDSATWNDASLERLIVYNLHYFDDLAAEGAAERINWHRELISRWLAENPPTQGAGWDPYPTSLRLVNWIKWLFAGNEPLPGMLDSLALQTRWLHSRLEYHLLGNHLLANAKALLFSGKIFTGNEADQWVQTGREILFQELDEQILPDGGHFERSPMYHAIITEDCLDLLQLLNLCSEGDGSKETLHLQEKLAELLPRMLNWLETMSQLDGQISLFNDAAYGVALEPEALYAYATRLGVSWASWLSGVRHLADSGYVVVEAEDQSSCLVMDTGLIGPDYQPGHAHCDTLSFEYSLDGRRIITDTGVSSYQNMMYRGSDRGTAAHNTVMIDGKEQSEIWAAHRVGRRAKPHNVKIKEHTGTVSIIAEHDGYERLQQGLRHRRIMLVGAGRLQWTDTLTGTHIWSVEGFLHFAPEVWLKQEGEGAFLIYLIGESIPLARCTVNGAVRTELRTSSYCPEFGKRIDRCCLVALAELGQEKQLGWRLERA